MALEMKLLLLWENWKLVHCRWNPPGHRDTCPCGGALAVAADGLRKLHCANVSFLCSSLNLRPVLISLSSGNSELVLLTHIPNHLREHVIQFNLKHKVNWTSIQIKWSFQFYVGDDRFCKGSQNRNQPDECFIWLFIFFQFTLWFSFNI